MPDYPLWRGILPIVGQNGLCFLQRQAGPIPFGLHPVDTKLTCLFGVSLRHA
ncbi:hypothetical protein AA0313_0917 [Acetobacter indonesiensis NRIC 0313]|uniref:Uncharacterized protein n=1 Tax=Acetobacter indonesiensis TaxID=104101 RepID=A0A6N3T979_9PROT|nr:hypothetical protein Abin_022_068 [Acetobacter indonesiensis]GBQ55651.1 hypothetical protein AA0313_0917 [Acetobacter indonesiensis NRIC 0313]GEN04159.1 hypothetical protein AIN02nite_21840 [Acetobacter indonesiensis]